MENIKIVTNTHYFFEIILKQCKMNFVISHFLFFGDIFSIHRYS